MISLPDLYVYLCVMIAIGWFPVLFLDMCLFFAFFFFYL